MCCTLLIMPQIKQGEKYLTLGSVRGLPEALGPAVGKSLLCGADVHVDSVVTGGVTYHLYTLEGN